MIQATYQDIRPLLQPGDIIAFGGAGAVSNLIKRFTFSTVSHVGIIMETKVLLEGEPQPGKIVDILESTTLNGKNGVQRNRMSERVDGYQGEMWWLQLSDEVRSQMDPKKFINYCLNQVGKPYDTLQAILCGLHLPQWDATGRLFCSEVACAALQAAGVPSMSRVIPSDVSPIELCQMLVYQKCVQLKGTAHEIRGFNTRSPWRADF